MGGYNPRSYRSASTPSVLGTTGLPTDSGKTGRPLCGGPFYSFRWGWFHTSSPLISPDPSPWILFPTSSVFTSHHTHAVEPSLPSWRERERERALSAFSYSPDTTTRSPTGSSNGYSGRRGTFSSKAGSRIPLWWSVCQRFLPGLYPVPHIKKGSPLPRSGKLGESWDLSLVDMTIP